MSVVFTTFQEEASVVPLLESLAAGARVPDEVVIVDGGSRDRTTERVRAFSAAHPGMRVRLLVEPGANVSRGRNLAIRAAAHGIVAITDAGVTVDREWLDRITAPFDAAQPADVVGGNFAPVVVNAFQRATLPLHHRPTTSIARSPSSRSIAMRKRVWEDVGGYPEWLLTAEDTLFNAAWRKSGAAYVFREDAIVRRRAVSSLRGLLVKARRYARGDGEALVGWRARLPQVAFHATILVGLVLALAASPWWLLVIPAGLLALVLDHARRGRLPRRLRDAPIYLGSHYLVTLHGSVSFVGGVARRAWWELRRRRPAMSGQNDTVRE